MYKLHFKDQIHLLEHSVHVTGRTFVHNFERPLPEQSSNFPCYLGWTNMQLKTGSSITTSEIIREMMCFMS